MSSIDSLQKIISLMQMQSLAKTEKKQASAATQKKSPTEKRNKFDNIDNLQHELGLFVEDIDADKPEELQRAREFFLRISLRQQFGGEIEGDPKFDYLIEQVDSAIQLDAKLLEEFHQTIIDIQKK